MKDDRTILIARGTRILQVLAGGLFLVAAAGKLLDTEPWSVAPLVLRGAPDWALAAATVVERSVPMLEILSGISLITGIGNRSGTALGAALGAIFLWVALAVPEGTSCGCFGILGDFRSPLVHAAIPAFLLVACAVSLGVRRMDPAMGERT